MIDSFGDSTRGGEWAAVRLLVDCDRVVEADAPGLDRDLRGLTLLEAAAVEPGRVGLDDPVAVHEEPDGGPLARSRRVTERFDHRKKVAPPCRWRPGDVILANQVGA